jgi:signal transduction histidine kinase/FixJ family two-component response regulator
MERNKLLERQLKKYLPQADLDDEKFSQFIEAVNDSYNSFDKDKQLSDHAFRLSDRDYKEINERLNNEVKLRNNTIEQLKTAVRNIQVDDNGHPVDNGDDLPGIISYLDKQITRRKVIEKELVAAKDAAEASTRAKELFLANMSHEIRTPMNAIFGMANQLGKTNLDGKQHFFLDTILTAAENLLIIINDILDLSKVESGKLSLEKIGFEPKKVIERVMNVMMHRAEEKGLKFTNSFCDASLSPILLGDPYRLNQVLLNLVSNAIKFTQEGKVDITCRVILNTPGRQKVQVNITDTGIGMEEEFAKKLFEKFTQEDNSIMRKYGGTGLGMSICKALIDLMDGQITVTSKKGGGTTVSFIIEMDKGRTGDLPQKEIEQTDTNILSGKKILVADDNEMNRLVVSTMLQYHGVEITEAVNGVEALEKLNEKNYDIVLMDVQMPVMDGFKATKLIRKTISTELPVIALTAYAIKGDDRKCIDAGMNDYLSKPFEENQLLRIMAHWLDKKALNFISTTEQTAQPVILYDLTGLHEIARGNADFITKMVDIFVQQTPAAVEAIKTAYFTGELEIVKNTAHKIKPSIDNMRITSLKNEIREIEILAGTNSKSERLEDLISLLEKTITKVVDSLNKNYN